VCTAASDPHLVLTLQQSAPGCTPHRTSSSTLCGGRGGTRARRTWPGATALHASSSASSHSCLLSSVVAIHNTVNERAWREVLAWEALHEGPVPPRLLRFVGRPQDFSPKARLLNLLGYKLPFDRHDWVVDRDGRQVRYVIDFYNAAPEPGRAVGMHLDVRPALDSAEAFVDRLRMQWRWACTLASKETSPTPQPASGGSAGA
jgi:cytochrome c heme-lyase